MSVWVIVGGQYGSEGKGKISAFITQRENIDICVRCGGPNSGHSFIDESGRNVVLRQLPTGFINPRTRLLIPAGALIDPVVLKQELEILSLPVSRIGIDEKSFIISEEDRESERGLGLRERLSSTLCGVGAAQARRVLRGENTRLAKNVTNDHPWLSKYLADVSSEVNTAVDNGRKVLVEGTQGFGLSFYHSDQYPKTTSRDTTAAGFMSEVGISPRLVTEVVLVLRTFPIRVAGNQAGLLREELTWEDVRLKSGYPWPVQELTSVTKLPRRVGQFDWDLAERAVLVNRPTRVAIMGLDYIDYGSYGVTDRSKLTCKVKSFLTKLEERLSSPIFYGSTSPALGHTFTLAPAGHGVSIPFSISEESDGGFGGNRESKEYSDVYGIRKG